MKFPMNGVTVTTADRDALIEFAKAQILAGQKLLASLNEEDGDAAETETAETPRRGPGRPRKNAAAPVARPAKKAAPKPAPEPEEDPEEEDEDEATERRTQLAAMKIAALRELAIKRGFQPDGVKTASKEDLIDAIANDEATDEDDEEDTDAEDVSYTREDLEGMGIRKVRALAQEQGHTLADLKGLKLDEVIDLMLGEGDAEGEGDEDEDEEGDGFYTREDFEKMSLAELKAVGRQYEQDYDGWKMPKGPVGKAALIDALLGEDDE